MQEIEFRGKAIDCLWSKKIKGDWIYGLPSYNGGKIAEIQDKDTKHYELIDTSTLGQYIGIKDIHGKKVFKGDIAKVKETIYADCSREEIEEIREFTGEVVQYQYSWCIAEKLENGTRYHSLWLWNVGCEEGEEDDTMEIIGNRWDNPEMKVIK